MSLLVDPDIAKAGAAAPPASGGGGQSGMTIALVNLMPALSARAVSRQYEDILRLAAGGIEVRLTVFSPGGGGGCEDISALWDCDVDALIVTGAEPQAGVITDEPCWSTLVKLADWASEHTVSVMWSCLAAHAVVSHLDGINRRRLGVKLSGVFDCEKVSGHGILAFMPPRWEVPHSRYHTLDEAALDAHGYTVVARGKVAGADIFIKTQRDSLFVFLQGHPEYEADTLLREYSRDIGRFLSGTQAAYPVMPAGYFDPDSAGALAAFQERAMRQPGLARLSEIKTCLARPPAGRWREDAKCLVSGWLAVIASRIQQGGAP